MEIRNIHVFTSLGLISSLTALFLFPSAFPWLAFVYATLGFFSSLKEVSKYTSGFQFFAVFVSCASVALLLEWEHFPAFPWMGVCMLFCYFGTIGRVIFFTRLTLTGGKWFEPLMLAGAIMTYLAGNLLLPYGWEGWVLPGICIAFQMLIGWGVYKDMKQLGSHALKGYKVQLETKAPDFSLPDQNGQIVNLADFRGKRHLLLIFVRGDWCPACHMMLRTYEKNVKKFMEKNIYCMAIGPDPVGVNREMVMKLGLEFSVLSDDRQQTAMKYGVQLENYDNDFADKYDEGIPLPASFLVDKDGIVRYVSRPDKVGEFLDPSRIFPIIDNLK